MCELERIPNSFIRCATMYASSASATLKIATLAPVPKAIEMIAMAVRPGLRLKTRSPCRRSCHSRSIWTIMYLNIYILEYMKTLIVELDDDIAARLERVAPGRAR